MKLSTKSMQMVKCRKGTKLINPTCVMCGSSLPIKLLPGAWLAVLLKIAHAIFIAARRRPAKMKLDLAMSTRDLAHSTAFAALFHRTMSLALLLPAFAPIDGFAAALSASVASLPPIKVRTNFEAASTGTIENLGSSELRVHVLGQANESGRNRQANWYYFRLDGVGGRQVTLHLIDFVGEYNFKPGACAMNRDTIPVFSSDGEHWQHFASMDWDDIRKEATLRFHADSDSLWVAHVPSYTLTRLQALLSEAARSEFAHIGVIGQSVGKRDLQLITITNPSQTAAPKKCVWLIARQHAWETGTSYVLEGALRFLISNDPKAAALRESVVFRLIPTMDPDGLALGHVRFNSLGYDLNRHWPEVNPSDENVRERMPEIWCVKRALFNQLDQGQPIDLLLNLHNTENNEYLETQGDVANMRGRLRLLNDTLKIQTTFDPAREPDVSASPPDTTNSLWADRGIPAFLMEQRIGTSPKLGRRATVADRLEFGKQLAVVLGKVAGTQVNPE
jgi:hypothetical protein